ncbi:MAG: RsmB/NOP family class I SAM-dependent RNA methyltransferase [Pseudomonadota bacterium]
MTPAARLLAAIDILTRWEQRGEPVDRLLHRWARENRYAGSKDRAAIGDVVYDALRHWRSGAIAGDTVRARILAGLLRHGVNAAEISALFSGERYAPPPLSRAERAAIEGPLPPPPSDWPAWLWPALEQSHTAPEAFAATQRVRAPVDLRVNRGDPAAVAVRLCEDGIETEQGPLSPTALRLKRFARVEAHEAYLAGEFDIQEVASQTAALLAVSGLETGGVSPLVIDTCAGGGGKSLAMAAAFGGAVPVIASDIAPQRMKDIPARSTRLGVEVRVTPKAALAAFQARADLVFVDAPCSGSGTWARTPDAKWLLTPDRLAHLGRAQADVIEQGAALVRPGGRLVYATCSVLRGENEDIVATFLNAAAGDAFSRIDLAPVWAEAGLDAHPTPKRFASGEARFCPLTTATDGFFVAVLQRR